MKKSKFKITSLILLGIVIPAIGGVHSVLAADVKRIAVLPFKINSEKDLSFLKDGIFDMLSTRLAKEGQVEVISRAKVDAALQDAAKTGTLNETAARSIGNGLNADYVLFGSLTVLGENVSIDTRMVDVSGAKPTMTFFDQSQNLGAVITKIDAMAADINAKMFGGPGRAVAEAAPPQPQPPRSEEKSSIHAHPESVLKKDGFIDHGRKEAADSGIMLGDGAARETQSRFWKSANFKFLINGVSLGDVDGDGQIETAAITPHSVVIFRYVNGSFSKIAEIDAGNSRNLTAVDIADINDNGYAEIFITSFNAQKTMLNSYVLEFDGSNFSKTIDGSYWIYRVADTSNRGKVLLGQRPRLGKTLSGNIYEMQWQGGEYVPTNEIKTPRHTNILGLTIGDVLDSGQENTIAYRDNDRIQILDSSGKAQWESADPYGGSMLYYAGPLEDRGQVENRKYFPMRLLVRQNPDGESSEVIAVKNYDLTNRKLEFRKLTKTHIEAFAWDGVGLRPTWRTRTMSGYIQDYNVGDYDNDGQDELIAALVLQAGDVAFISEPKSTLIGLELGSAQQPE